MKRRLFISIKIPEEIRKTVREELNKIKLPQKLQARFVPEKNWHITVLFMGYIEENEIENTAEAISDIKKEYTGGFEVTFEKINYGPPGSVKRMIWLKTNKNTSDIIGRIKNSLENGLKTRGIFFEHDFKDFNGHVTLAKFMPASERELPGIEKTLALSFKADTMFLTESHLEKSGANYEDLEEVFL